jgi:hypothetical protein
MALAVIGGAIPCSECTSTRIGPFRRGVQRQEAVRRGENLPGILSADRHSGEALHTARSRTQLLLRKWALLVCSSLVHRKERRAENYSGNEGDGTEGKEAIEMTPKTRRHAAAYWLHLIPIEAKEVLLLGAPVSGPGGPMPSAKFPSFDQLGLVVSSRRYSIGWGE